jgi:hypothetical protein
LMECLVLPLQDKLEEWKKFVINLDKEHSKGTSRLVFYDPSTGAPATGRL